MLIGSRQNARNVPLSYSFSGYRMFYTISWKFRLFNYQMLNRNFMKFGFGKKGNFSCMENIYGIGRSTIIHFILSQKFLQDKFLSCLTNIFFIFMKSQNSIQLYSTFYIYHQLNNLIGQKIFIRNFMKVILICKGWFLKFVFFRLVMVPKRHLAR